MKCDFQLNNCIFKITFLFLVTIIINCYYLVFQLQLTESHSHWLLVLISPCRSLLVKSLSLSLKVQSLFTSLYFYVPLCCIVALNMPPISSAHLMMNGKQLPIQRQYLTFQSLFYDVYVYFNVYCITFHLLIKDLTVKLMVVISRCVRENGLTRFFELFQQSSVRACCLILLHSCRLYANSC